MLIRVTQKHIDAGVKAQCDRCPISLAVLEATECADAFVASDYVNIRAQGSYSFGRIPLPQAAIDFIHDFDTGKPVKPFEFQLSCSYE